MMPQFPLIENTDNKNFLSHGIPMKKNYSTLTIVPGAWQGAHCISCHCGYEDVLIFPFKHGFSLNL